MGSLDDHRYRIQIDVPEELYDRAYKLIPWGERNELFRVIIEQLLDSIEKHGVVVAALISNKRLKLFGG